MAISEAAGVILYREHLSLGARIFIGALGLVMAVLGPAAMISIAVPQWSLSFILTIFTGLALLSFGVFALTAALGGARTLEFGLARRVLVVSTRGPLTRSRAEYAFSAIPEPFLEMRESEDGPYPVLGLALPGEKRRLEMTGFADAGEAIHWQKRLTAALANQLMEP